jgi:hypothetical protein
MTLLWGKNSPDQVYNHNSPSPKKMACTTQSKILAISSNPETIRLLLIVGELWDPEMFIKANLYTLMYDQLWKVHKLIGVN